MRANTSRHSYYRGPSRMPGAPGTRSHRPRSVEHHQQNSLAPLLMMAVVGLVIVAKVR